MNVRTLSLTLKTLNDSLVELMLNGWMSGSYTGAVLTTECHSESESGDAVKALPGSFLSLTLFE